MKTFAVEFIFLGCLVVIIHSQLSVIHNRPYLSAAHLLHSSSIASARESKGHRQLRQPDVEHLDNFSDNIDREDNTALPSTTRISISNEYGERVPPPFDTPLATFDSSVQDSSSSNRRNNNNNNNNVNNNNNNVNSNNNSNNNRKKVNVNSIRLIDPFKQPDPYEISPDPLVESLSNFGDSSNKTERRFSTRNGVYSLKEQSFFAASEQDNSFAPSEDSNNEPEDEESKRKSNDNSNDDGPGGYSENVQSSSTSESSDQDENFVLNKLTSSSSDTRKKRLNQCVQTCIDDAFDSFK